MILSIVTLVKERGVKMQSVAVADCLATNKACHSGVSRHEQDGRLVSGTLRLVCWSEMFAQRLPNLLLSFPTRLFCFVPRILHGKDRIWLPAPKVWCEE